MAPGALEGQGPDAGQRLQGGIPISGKLQPPGVAFDDSPFRSKSFPANLFAHNFWMNFLPNIKDKN
jgi:hypothetical protein